MPQTSLPLTPATFATLVLSLGCLCHAARGQFAFVSVASNTDAYTAYSGAFPASGPHPQESNTAIGPWDSDINSTVGTNSIRAAQHVAFSPNNLTASGGVTFSFWMTPSQTGVSEQGASNLSCVFSVTDTTHVSLLGHISYMQANLQPSVAYDIFLERTSGSPSPVTLRRTFWGNGNGSQTASFNADVAPGTYRLRVADTVAWSPSDFRPTSQFSRSLAWDVSLTLTHCGSADFNHDGDIGTDGDIEAFFRCLAGNCCAACDSADFNGDGDIGTDADIEAFFRVLAGSAC